MPKTLIGVEELVQAQQGLIFGFDFKPLKTDSASDLWLGRQDIIDRDEELRTDRWFVTAIIGPCLMVGDRLPGHDV